MHKTNVLTKAATLFGSICRFLHETYETVGGTDLDNNSKQLEYELIIRSTDGFISVSIIRAHFFLIAAKTCCSGFNSVAEFANATQCNDNVDDDNNEYNS